MVSVYKINSRKKRNPFRGFSLTLNIIIINVAIFLPLWLLLLSGTISEEFFFSNIAISLENIKELRLWTFLTSMFMHGGFFHLFANMFSLFFIGSLVEKILGKKRYLWFYLIAGLFAGLLYILVELIYPSNLPAVGASGALFGLVGVLILLTPNLPVYVMFIPIPIKMKYAGPGILILLWIISITADVGIGNTAHLGGLIAGLVYGLYLRNKFPNKVKKINKVFS